MKQDTKEAVAATAVGDQYEWQRQYDWPMVGGAYERDGFARVVKESNDGIYLEPNNLDVIYSLYRKQRIWNQHKQGTPGEYTFEWWYVREESCSIKTWARWVKKAALRNG